MTSFGWKKKKRLKTKVAAAFGAENNEEEEEKEVLDMIEVDWLTAVKRKKVLLLEDSKTKSKRLFEEGVFLAENQRYWEAIGRWDEALQLTPDSAVLHEMKAQALMEVGEVFPAVQSAEEAVKLSPAWATGLQTLGRSQLGIGEVHMALLNFEKAVHLDPSCVELWEHDLCWAWDLAKRKESMATRAVDKNTEEQRED